MPQRVSSPFHSAPPEEVGTVKSFHGVYEAAVKVQGDRIWLVATHGPDHVAIELTDVSALGVVGLLNVAVDLARKHREA